MTSVDFIKIFNKIILNKSGLSIDPCGTPATISSHELNWSFILNLCLRSVKQPFINFNDSIEKPYPWSFATIRSCGRQSKALERSVRKAPYSFPWSNAFSQFSAMAIRQSWVLYPFRKPHWNLDNSVSKYSEFCLCIHLWKFFEMLGNKLTGQQFFKALFFHGLV